MARDPPPPEPHRSFANALCVPRLAPQARLTSIKDSLDARDTGRGDSPEVAVAKARLNEIKTKSRMLQQEKRLFLLERRFFVFPVCLSWCSRRCAVHHLRPRFPFHTHTFKDVSLCRCVCVVVHMSVCCCCSS